MIFDFGKFGNFDRLKTFLQRAIKILQMLKKVKKMLIYVPQKYLGVRSFI